MKKIKFAILSDNLPSYRKPMALALSRMLTAIDVDHQILWDSTDFFYVAKKPFNTLKILIKKILNLFRVKHFTNVNFINQKYFLENLKQFDVIIIIGHLPLTLARKSYQGVELIREKCKNIPIINYDLCFWGTRGNWLEFIKRENRYGGFFGLNRFDYYLAISNISEDPQNRKISWPVAVIGGDFRNELLIPKQTIFKALVDFKRDNHLLERKIQLEVLNELAIPYTILEGTYSQEDIYRIYSEHAAYFLAHRESFGLPIVELQNCGCYILTPYKNWAPSHYINKEVWESGEGDLSPNFIVYDNDKEKLKKELLRLKQEYDPSVVINNFSKYHSQLRFGDLDGLQKVINDISSGKINSKSHVNYKSITN